MTLFWRRGGKRIYSLTLFGDPPFAWLFAESILQYHIFVLHIHIIYTVLPHFFHLLTRLRYSINLGSPPKLIGAQEKESLDKCSLGNFSACGCWFPSWPATHMQCLDTISLTSGINLFPLMLLYWQFFEKGITNSLVHCQSFIHLQANRISQCMTMHSLTHLSEVSFTSCQLVLFNFLYLEEARLFYYWKASVL